MKLQYAIGKKKWHKLLSTIIERLLGSIQKKKIYTKKKKPIHTKNCTLDEKVVSFIQHMYIEIVARTSRIQLQGAMQREILRNAVIGFWHGDSFGMNFLLREVQDEKNNIDIIITADKRGKYIENIIRAYDAKALRMPDGAKLRYFLKDLKEVAKKPQHTLCIALDGPLGPLYEPKKIGFMLAEEGNKPVILIKVDYTKKLQLFKRWDNYVIPLPFGKMTFTAYSMGKVSKEELRDFSNYKHKILRKMI